MLTPLVIATPTGARLRVRLTPKAAADRIDAVGADADGSPILLARVRAAPEKGAANQALETLLAKELGLKRSAVRVARGATARLKFVDLDDAAPETLVARFSQLTARA